jgi:AraC-like DNA-binding protein
MPVCRRPRRTGRAASPAFPILRCHAGGVRYLLGMPQAAVPSGEPSAGVGVLTLLARGSVGSINSFHHDAHPVRDPAEEWFSGDTLIFTVGGSWRVRSRHGWVDANPDLLVLGRAGTPYRCDHGRGVPADRNLAVMLHPGALAPIVGVDTDPLSAALLEQPIPDLPSLPVTAELALTARRLAVECARIPALPGRSLRIDCLVVDLLVQLHRASGRYAAPCPPAGPLQRQAIHAVTGYIAAHLEEDLGLATLAAVAHLSPFHFSRLFRAVTGTPPSRYVRNARLRRAEDLLATTDATVTAIAHRVGFGSVSHFVNVFKDHVGLTPGRYRDALRRT